MPTAGTNGAGTRSTISKQVSGANAALTYRLAIESDTRFAHGLVSAPTRQSLPVNFRFADDAPAIHADPNRACWYLRTS